MTSPNNIWFGGRRPSPSDSMLFGSPSTSAYTRNASCVVSTRCGEYAQSNTVSTRSMFTTTYCVVVDYYLGWWGIIRSVRNDGGDDIVVGVVVVKVEMVDAAPCDTMHHKLIRLPSRDVSAAGADGLHLFWGWIDEWGAKSSRRRFASYSFGAGT